VIADWYFDFVSPFAYLQSERLATLAPRIEIRYKPVLFAALLDAHGHKGPAEIPSKRTFIYRQCLWQAARMGVPLRFPPEHPFNPLPLLRLAIACDSTPAAIHRIFRFVWRDGRLPDLPIEWAELVNDLGLARAEARIAAPEVKAELRQNTDEAITRGVWGVPTLHLAGELFWGVDATAMAADFAAANCRWIEPEYVRVADLPVGAARAPKPRAARARPKGSQPLKRS
jgi:2-hydroxychromene-2-carboxylate isomerase